MIPFLVADRPASLRILSGLDLPSSKRIMGLMTHANTTDRFAELYKNFPCGEPEYCNLTYGTKSHVEGKCRYGIAYSAHFVKMGDSGVFTRDGCKIPDYDDLYRKYRRLGVEFGIMIDYLKDSDRTLESATRAMEVYLRHPARGFKLVGVAQGNSLAEYLDCYSRLREIGFERIALGGLLRKKENSKRFVHVRDEQMMYKVLRVLRRKYPKDWMFALGAYHPKRHNRLDALNVWGGDYKGWIFHYPTPRGSHPRRWHDRRRYAAVRRYVEAEVVARVTGETWNRNLLVLGCSKAKVGIREPLPAIERYDGPSFQMVRKLFFDGLHLDVDLMILSGRFGLLQPGTLLPMYDYTISGRAIDSNVTRLWRAELSRQVRARGYEEVFLAMGRDYAAFLDGPKLRGAATKVMLPAGPIGKRLGQTKRWLLSKSNRAIPAG